MAYDFAAADLHAAAEEAFGSDKPDPLAAALAAPQGLPVTIALELASQIVPATAGDRAVTDGATAVISGLLVASKLVPGDHRIVTALPGAIDTVRTLGRSAVIARYCDLSGVADVERLVGRAIAQEPAREEVLQSVLQLFELGLAIGVAALCGDDSPPQ